MFFICHYWNQKPAWLHFHMVWGVCNISNEPVAKHFWIEDKAGWWKIKFLRQSVIPSVVARVMLHYLFMTANGSEECCLTTKCKLNHKKWLVLGHMPHTFQLPHFCEKSFDRVDCFSFCSLVWKRSFLITVFLFLVALTWLHGESLEGFTIMLKLWQACCNRWIWPQHIACSERKKKRIWGWDACQTKVLCQSWSHCYDYGCYDYLFLFPFEIKILLF